MFELLQPLVRAIQPFLVPICFVITWAIVVMAVWSLWTAIRDTIARSRKMHQIPCSECQFFTSNYHLKCTIHPSQALTEEAIHCPDYEPPVMGSTLQHRL